MKRWSEPHIQLAIAAEAVRAELRALLVALPPAPAAIVAGCIVRLTHALKARTRRGKAAV